MTNQTTPQPTPKKKPGRPRKLIALNNPIRVLVVNRRDDWIGAAQVEASSIKRLSHCRDEKNVKRLIRIFRHYGFVIQEITDEVQS